MLSEARLIETRLGRLAVREYGDGRPALLWHSMFVDSSSWDRIIPLLAKHRRLLVVDGPGYGDSDELASVSSMAVCADAALDLLDGLGHPTVDWVGNAWGGHVAYQLDMEHPGRLRSLVAVSAPPQPLGAADRMKLRVLRPVLAAFGPVPFLVDLVAEAQLTDFSRAADPALVTIIRESMNRQSRRSLSTTVASFIIGRRDLGRAVRLGRAPALFVASDDRGEWSPADARAAADSRRGARAETVSWSRTLVPLEQPVALAEKIVAFWAELDENAVVDGK